jgi:hypothetical protein
MAKNKKSKSLLNEATVRRMMKLADIPELSDNFLSEESESEMKWGGNEKEDHRRMDADGHKHKIGDVGGGKYGKGGHFKDFEQPYGGDEGDESKTHPDHKDYMEEDKHEEEEIDAMGDELGAEDHEADEEADELDAEASEGDAEITPEAAQAIVDLAAQLEASGALEDAGAGEEVEAEIEMSDDDGEMEEEEIEELDEALAKLGIEVVDDKKLQETVRKRVIARLLKEKKEQQRAKQIDRLADRIFARLKGK